MHFQDFSKRSPRWELTGHQKAYLLPPWLALQGLCGLVLVASQEREQEQEQERMPAISAGYWEAKYLAQHQLPSLG